MQWLYVRPCVWVAVNVFNAAMLTFILWRITWRVLPAFDEPYGIAMLCAAIPTGFVVGIKTLHRA